MDLREDATVYSDPDWIEKVASKGETIYEEQIKPLVEPLHYGKFLVVDVDTGDYEIGSRMLIASKKLRERRPNAVTFGLRVGFLAAYRMGGRNLNPENDDRTS